METQATTPAQAAPAAQAPAKASKPKKASKPAKAKKGKSAVKGKTGPAVLQEYAPKYNKDTKVKTAGGNTSVDSNDTLAKKLRGKTLDEVYAMAGKIVTDKDENVVGEAALRKQYKHLNVGMQRMNLGNRMRGVLNAK